MAHDGDARAFLLFSPFASVLAAACARRQITFHHGTARIRAPSHATWSRWSVTAWLIIIHIVNDNWTWPTRAASEGLAAPAARAGTWRAIDTPRNDKVLLGGSSGAIMPDMGTFRIDIELENPALPGERRVLPSVLVDTGAELSWVPAEVLESLGIERYAQWRFRQADGTVLERWTGPAFVHAAGKRTTDDVVFGEPGDLVLLGARSLEGLNLRIDPVSRRLVDAGPAPAAATV
jgi:clan AA aspartic protease